MKLKAIAPWFGGKRTMAPRIAAELGEHRQYFEPFCGSAAVLFAKPESRQETVNDLHGGLINLARVLASDRALELYNLLQRTLVNDALLADAEEFLNDLPEVPLPGQTLYYAYWYFIACWMARNGLAGTAQHNYQLAVRWTAGGGSATIRFRSAVDSIPAWHQRLRNVVILCRDAFEIVPKFEDARHTAIYVDPPYPAETRSPGARFAGQHSGRYLHEFKHGRNGDGDLFAEADDHARLAEILRKFQHARIVVSSYDCERIRELYDGWTVVDCKTTKQLAAQNQRDRNSTTEAPEILLINGASYT